MNRSVQVLEALPRECLLSEDLAATLGCQHGDDYMLRAGSVKVPVRVLVDPSLGAQDMVLTRRGAGRILLPPYLETNVALRGDEISLGPVVGVFINRKAYRKIAQGRAGFRIEELVKANQKAKCILYFFSTRDEKGPLHYMSGFRYDHLNKQWGEEVLPPPDVLYDRGGGFTTEQKPLALALRRRLRAFPGLTQFNARHTFSKWDLHVRLSKHPVLRPHLPETVPYGRRSDLARMLRTYGTVYIKSVSGSNGREVMRVVAQNGQFRYDWFGNRAIRETCRDLAALEGVVERFLRGKEAVIQQGVRVLTVDQSSVDVRVLAAKDALGQWCLIDMPARVGRKGCAVTSTRTGAAVYPLETCFERILGFSAEQVERVKKKIRDVVLSTVHAIEAEYGSFGEVGVDVAVDVDGHPWILEANAKPGKDTIRLSGNREALSSAFYLPLQYCKRIAGFTTEGGRSTPAIVRSTP